MKKILSVLLLSSFGLCGMVTAQGYDPISRKKQDIEALSKGNRLAFVENEIGFHIDDFTGTGMVKAEFGCELSDFGSWYNLGYSGGVNRFWINSVRNHKYGYEFTNSVTNVALIALFFQTPDGRVIDQNTSITWHINGWTTTTKDGQLEIQSRVLFTQFNTVHIFTEVKNNGNEATQITPSLMVTAHANYREGTEGRIQGSTTADGQLRWNNRRSDKGVEASDYDDVMVVGSDLGKLRTSFLPVYYSLARGEQLKSAIALAQSSALDSDNGCAISVANAVKLAPGESRSFTFYVAADPKAEIALKTATNAKERLQKSGSAAVVQEVDADWNNYLGSGPKPLNPTYEQLKLYYLSISALRANIFKLQHKGETYDVSFPGRGGFNLFFQSDACWSLLGYLNIKPQWAVSHAIPILDPPSDIMDPHFYWSTWEIYSRLTSEKDKLEFARKTYPYLKEAYRYWTTNLDPEGDLLCSTPNNWDDGPRADLLFREFSGGSNTEWNNWWGYWVTASKENALHDPASSSQLGYGTIVMKRFAEQLGETVEAKHWDELSKKHVQAINTLWDEELGYWIVTYRGTLKDKVLTSSIIYPLFTEMCRDTARIKRVIERIIDPAQFNGKYPTPTVAYNDPRYFKQKPPQENEEGGLWRGNVWLPESWLVVKGLYKFGYEDEAADMARKLVDMMSNQPEPVAGQLFHYSPAEWYDTRTGIGQNNRQFSWTLGVALDFMLGNYQNERVLGTNAKKDMRISGHVREIFDFESGKSMMRVFSAERVYPLMKMNSGDNKPIQSSVKVEFSFTDPAGNLTGKPIEFIVENSAWSVVEKRSGEELNRNSKGAYQLALGVDYVLVK